MLTLTHCLHSYTQITTVMCYRGGIVEGMEVAPPLAYIMLCAANVLGRGHGSFCSVAVDSDGFGCVTFTFIAHRHYIRYILEHSTTLIHIII